MFFLILFNQMFHSMLSESIRIDYDVEPTELTGHFWRLVWHYGNEIR